MDERARVLNIPATVLWAGASENMDKWESG